MLIDAFPHFREKILPFNGMWSDFLNRLNAKTRVHTAPTNHPVNPLYRHVESPDLATLLCDLGVLRFDHRQMAYEMDEKGRKRLQKDMTELWQKGI